MSKTSDNVNLDFPARMADGRTFTDYRANCIMNHQLSGAKNSFVYRYFLENNGAQIEQIMLSKLDAAVKCDNCNAQTVLPVQTVQNCNLGKCTISMNDPNGLGLDRSNTYQEIKNKK
jgi:hypothetical protein